MFILQGLFFIHLKNSGKYRLICSLIISRVINFNFLYFITVLFTKKYYLVIIKGKTKMTIISIEKATILDAEKLTEIMTRTFDEEKNDGYVVKVMLLTITSNHQGILQ